jgi:BirA family biotin operon repressor/biotin-[acetyl-CoA-carboxylase] ligase
MRKLAEGKATEGLLVWSDYQTAGRGQRGSHWEAAPGLNLTFSIALFPQIPIEQQFYLNIMSSLAICDALTQYGKEHLRIKWPNDIYYHDQKLCGILLQNNLRLNKIHSSALGIGLNVNQLHFEEARAVSLKKISGQARDRAALLTQVAEHLEARYFELRSGSYNSLKRAYLPRLYRLYEWHTYESAEGRFEGRIVGISREGQLAVETSGGLKYFAFKEISYLP